MIETEAKMRLEDRDGLEQRLRRVGAARGPAIRERDVFFDTAERRLLRADEGLRLRVAEREAGRSEAVITHKGPRAAGGVKQREETELHVASAEDAEALLEALGYVVVLRFEKNRQRWLWDDVRVELDRVPELGDFVEIEGPNEQSVLEARTHLGLDRHRLVPEPYVQLVAEARDAGRL